MADETITFIRGADGVLYALSEDQLKRYPPANAAQVNDILDKAKEDFKVAKLSPNIVKQIQQVNGCVKTTAVSPEAYSNTKK